MPIILAFQANPLDHANLQLDVEIRDILHHISPLAKRDLHLQQVGACRISDLTNFLLEMKPDILHFAGHGTEDGELVFEDDAGYGQPASVQAIKVLFGKLGKTLKCVVLNACFSQRQAEQIAKFIPYVIGNTHPIGDEEARTFASSFYGTLSYGKSIEEAFEIAKAVTKGTYRNLPNLPKLYRNKRLAQIPSIIFQQPIIKACFLLKRDGRPKKMVGHYTMKIWVENLPRNTLSIFYHFNHKTVLKKYDEVLNDGSGIETEFDLYGNIQIRVTLWLAKEGIGLVTTLMECLDSYYASQTITPPIADALEHIRTN